MIYHVRTETGSLYKIDDEAMTWERIEATDLSGPIRSQAGVYYELFGELQDITKQVGKPLTLVMQPIDSRFSGRIIQTSNVVDIY